MKNIILASQSEGRKELFSHYFGKNFTIIVSHAHEEDLSYLQPHDMVLALAERKAQIIATTYPHDFVCAFDTLVECQHKILGKPHNINEAYHMLTTLNHQLHIVWTGYAIAYQGKIFSGVEHAQLILKMSDEQIRTYIRKHPVTKFAGAYAIQKKDATIELVSGAMDTIIGAPMKTIVNFIHKHQ